MSVGLAYFKGRDARKQLIKWLNPRRNWLALNFLPEDGTYSGKGIWGVERSAFQLGCA